MDGDREREIKSAQRAGREAKLTKRIRWTNAMRRILYPLYGAYVDRCHAMKVDPETFDRWAGDPGDWLEGRTVSPEWTSENIGEGLRHQRLTQYDSPIQNERCISVTKFRATYHEKYEEGK